MGRKSAHGLPPGIQKDKDGVFWARLEGDDARCWRDRYPDRSVPRRKAATLKEAMQLQRQMIRDLDTGRDPNADNPLVKAWVRAYIDDRETIKPSTARRYDRLLRLQIEPYTLGRLRLSQATHQRVKEWVRELKAASHHDDPESRLDPYTIRNAFALLRAALNKAVALDLIAKNPCTGIELPAPDDEEVEPLTAAQADQLLTLVDTLDEGKPHRLAALYHVAIRCGLRQGELFGLSWSDIDYARSELRVSSQMQEGKRSTTKTKGSRRTLPLSPDLVRVLRRHQQNQREEQAIGGGGWNTDSLVFCSEHGTPLNPSNTKRQFDSLLRRAELPAIKFHHLRHTYATLSIAAGVDLYTLSRRMGHSSISVTADRYGHLYQAQSDDAAAVDRLLKRAK